MPKLLDSRIVRESLMQMEAESDLHAEQLGVKPHGGEPDDSASEVADQEDVEIAVSEIVPHDELRQVGINEPSKYEHHRLSGVIHLILDDDRFACGRVRSLNYLPCESASVFGTPPVSSAETCKVFASRVDDA